LDTLAAFKQIEKSLQKTYEFWFYEPLFHYPNLSKEVLDLISELKDLDLDELIKLENLEETKLKSKVLSDYFTHIKKSLQSFEAIKKDYPLSPNKLRGIGLKKSHEIKRILSLLASHKFNKIFDIGSGKGHLSFLMAQNFENNEYICIDMDDKLQKNAQDKFKDIDPQSIKKLTYINQKVDEKSKLEINKDDLLLGLHACGDLSSELLTNHLKSKGSFLNFPCCYHKCSQLNFSGEMQLELNLYALNLANRSKVLMNQKSYKEREKIKRYRYTLEFAYYDKYQKHLTELGNAPRKIYDESFKTYIEFYDQGHFGLENCEGLLEQYSTKVDDYILFEVLRNPLGQLLEQYILLDRVLYAQKFNRELKILEVFDKELSPRNLALFYKN
jgi:hypothetical protein